MSRGSKVVGDRTPGDELTYPDIDLELKVGPDGVRRFVIRTVRRIRNSSALNHSARHRPLAGRAQRFRISIACRSNS